MSRPISQTASWVRLTSPGLSERISLPRSDCTSRKHLLAPQGLHHSTTPMHPLAFFGGFSDRTSDVGRAWIVLDRRSFDMSARQRRERTVILHVSALPSLTLQVFRTPQLDRRRDGGGNLIWSIVDAIELI